MEQLKLKIEGMACEHCVKAVTQALDALPIEIIKVEIGGAEVKFEPGKVSAAQIAEAIEGQGFAVV